MDPSSTILSHKTKLYPFERGKNDKQETQKLQPMIFPQIFFIFVWAVTMIDRHVDIVWSATSMGTVIASWKGLQAK